MKLNTCSLISILLGLLLVGPSGAQPESLKALSKPNCPNSMNHYDSSQDFSRLSVEAKFLSLIESHLQSGVLRPKDVKTLIRAIENSSQNINPISIERAEEDEGLTYFTEQFSILTAQEFNRDIVLQHLNDIVRPLEVDTIRSIEPHRTVTPVGVKKMKFGSGWPISIAETQSTVKSKGQAFMMLAPVTNWQWASVMKYLNSQAHDIDLSDRTTPSLQQYRFELENREYLDHPNRPVSEINWIEVLGGSSKSTLSVEGADLNPRILFGKNISSELAASREPLLSTNYNNYLVELAINWSPEVIDNKLLETEGFIGRLNRWSASDDKQIYQVISDHKKGDFYRLPSEREWIGLLSDQGRYTTSSEIRGSIKQPVFSSERPPVGSYHLIRRSGSTYSDIVGSVRQLLIRKPQTSSWATQVVDWISGGAITRLSVTLSGVKDRNSALLPTPYDSSSVSRTGFRLVRVRRDRVQQEESEP